MEYILVSYGIDKARYHGETLEEISIKTIAEY